MPFKIAKEVAIGDTFGEWTIIGFAPNVISKNGNILRRLLARCKCGIEKEVTANNLFAGKSKRCGKCVSEKFVVSQKRRRKEDGEVNKYQAYRAYYHHAVKRNFSFDISFEQFIHIAQQNCHYCGIEPYNEYNLKHPPSAGKLLAGQPRYNQPFIYNGVDRVDSCKGYFPENCVPCCPRCNRAKSDMSIAEFRGWFERVIKQGTLL